MPHKQNKKKPPSIKPVMEGAVNFIEQNTRRKQHTKRTSAACEAWKKRKTKCSGDPAPCHMCEQLDTLCVIDLTLDMRRRTALQRIMEESAVLQHTLNNIIEVLSRADLTEIQELIAQSQRVDKSEELTETLQARPQATSESNSQSTNREMKEELEESLKFGLEEDCKTKASSGSSFASELPRMRSLSMHEDDGPGSSISPGRLGTDQDQEFEDLASMYSPLIWKLKTISDWEATCMLHNFRTSPLTTDLAILGLFEQRHSRPKLSLTSERQSQFSTSCEIKSSDRTNWYSSLQLTSPEFQTPITLHTSEDLWNDKQRTMQKTAYGDRNDSAQGQMSASEGSTINSSQPSLSDSYVRTMAMSSIQEASEAASKEVQTYPAVYSSMQVNKISQVVEMFGDLRALGGRNYLRDPISLQEVVAQSSATIPKHLIQSRLALQNSPLSKVLTDFRDAARQMIATGTPASDILCGSDVVVDLFFRDRQSTDAFTCASWACEVYRSFGDLPDIVCIGNIFLLTRLMRWMIYPTPETYAEVPESQRPTPTQCFVPHIPAIDLHPMPVFRDILCNQRRDWLTSMKSTGISCNWSFRTEKVLENDPASGSIKISKPFAEHVAKCENWSFNSYALSIYPELEGKIRIEDA